MRSSRGQPPKPQAFDVHAAKLFCMSAFAQTLPLRTPIVFTKDDSANSEDTTVDKDRIKGSAEQIKGTVKEAVGKVLGDKKLETEGTTDKAAGKVQNAIGGLKDAVRGK
jgi:uncharacterized protein YjbJ (UPF0337 family)